MNRAGIYATLLLVTSLVVLFVAERVFADGTSHDVLVGLGALMALGATGWRVAQRAGATGDARRIETDILLAYCGVLVAIGLYGLSTDAGLQVVKLDPDGRPAVLLAVLWPAVLIVALAALGFQELAWQRMPIPAAADLRRVRYAAQGGLALALSLVFVVSINYAAAGRDVEKDLSYFKTTRPSDATLQMVKALGSPVTIVAFFPPVNAVRDQAMPYLEEVAKASDQVELRALDHALAPELARQHAVRGNGFVALLKGEGETQQAETIEIGTELEVARSRLRTLDGRFQEAFLKLTKTRRMVYLTNGHEERSNTGVEDPPEQRMRDLMTALSRSNIGTKTLGLAEGLARQVPEDAPGVAVFGPRKPFLPEEAQSLLAYVRGGGRLLVLVDPDEEHGLEPLLEGLGLELLPGVLASEREHLQRTRTLADRRLVHSNRYTAHPTVTMANQIASRAATIFVGGGALERSEPVPDGIRAVFPIRFGNESVWRDLDGDFERGPEEKLSVANPMAAITVAREDGDEGRAVIIADGEFATDQVFRNPGNAVVVADSLNWLLGEEQIVGQTNTEEDQRIEHTREEDKVWFYATSFGAPLPLLAAGVLVGVRRRRRHVRKSEKGGKAKRGSGPPPNDRHEPEPAKASAARADGAVASAEESSKGADAKGAAGTSDTAPTDDAATDDAATDDAAKDDAATDDAAKDDAAEDASKDEEAKR